MREVVVGRGSAGSGLVVSAGPRALLTLGVALAVALVCATPADDAAPLDGALAAWLLEDGAVRPLADGAEVRPGARVQLGYRLTDDAGAAPLALHAVLLSVDDGGRRTLHFPYRVDAPTLVDGAAGVLAASFELDGTPGTERFYLVLSARPLSPRALLAAELERKPSFSLRKATRAPGGEEVR